MFLRKFLPLLLLPALGACHPAEPVAEARPELSPIAAMQEGDLTGYALADEARAFQFPGDHDAHPDFRTEWWYFVGHLETAEGRRFGYQLTFFRQALRPDSEERTSSWATRHVYMAHFALSDVEGKVFHSAERFARGAAGLAGVEGEEFRVWVEDWQARASDSEERYTEDPIFPLRLEASDGPVTLEIELVPERPAILQGDNGLSRKGPSPGSASYYYSYTRLRAAGQVTLADGTHDVTGSGWFDREWSTSGLEPGQKGWDWFALQLEDGQDLMVYQIRLDDGSIEPLSHGALVAPDGTHRHLSIAEVSLEILDRWPSPTGSQYPAHWRLQVPEYQLDLEVRPVLADQELQVAYRYWEGAVDVSGTSGGKEVRGRGFVELVGY